MYLGQPTQGAKDAKITPLIKERNQEERDALFPKMLEWCWPNTSY